MKKTGSLFIFLFIIILFPFAPGIAEAEVLSSLEEIAAYASANNLTVRASLLQAAKAEDDIISALKLKFSEVTGDFQYSDTQDNSGWTNTGKITLPILDQISISGQIDTNMNYQFGISLNPLAHSDTDEQAVISYQSALLKVENERLSAEQSAVQSALSWMTALKDLEIQEESTALKKTLYDDEKIRYERGEVTLDDVQTALLEWSEARSQVSGKQEALRQAETALYSALGMGTEVISIEPLTTGDLRKALLKIQEQVSPDTADPVSAYSVQSSYLQIESSQVKLKNTWIFDPGLSANANLGFDTNNQMVLSAGVSVSFSPDNINASDRDEMKQDLALSRVQTEQSVRESSLALQQAVDSLSSSRLNRKVAEIELEQAEALVSEAEFLRNTGDFSDLELEETYLTLRKAENSLFQAYAEEYKAWLAIKAFL